MTPTSVRRLKHWGWGYEDQHLGGEALVDAAKGIVEHLGFGSADVETPVALEDVELAESRLAPPASLASIFSDDRYERLSHGLGKAYRDVVRGFRGQFEHP
ncbi:MAG: alkyldihydroxyacetonephosphate synthase, partial [Solirubrobacterales bacterium]|nr:alkyldihydroxyacetonephosphate synthase [Solirubrobacterales bacterium]